MTTSYRARPRRTDRQRRLLLSIHDVSPRYEREISLLRDHLRSEVDGPVAMLVVPDFWNEAPISMASPFAARIREWAEGGDEIFLHGYTHLDRELQGSPKAPLAARLLTAGKGEFLSLACDEARRRIRLGRDLLEELSGRPIAGFVAPAWLYGAGAQEALSSEGIALAEDHWRVWQPRTGRELARSPVVTWATRTPTRLASSLLIARLARTLPLRRVMRIGVHPDDCGSLSVMKSISATVRHVKRTHLPSRYDSLASDVRCAS